jgi:hypothetical protein
MKRAHAAASRQSSLARQRSLVRRLIEQNGWSKKTAVTSEKTRQLSSPLPSNIIPFPGMEEQARIS